MRLWTACAWRMLTDVYRRCWRWCVRVRAVCVLQPGESEDTEVQSGLRCELSAYDLFAFAPSCRTLPDLLHKGGRPLHHRRYPVRGAHTSPVLEACKQHQL